MFCPVPCSAAACSSPVITLDPPASSPSVAIVLLKFLLKRTAVSKNIEWKLIDPHSKKIKKSINARELWRLILETRHETGEPYLHFVDTSNKSLPETQKKLGLSIKQSNLCSEITLPTDEDRTAVCCLSSVNLAKYDEWSTSPTFIPDMVRMLDNVLEHFIQATYDFSYDYKGEVLDMKVKEGMEGFTKAGYSAYRERSLGLGAMGFHTYLQKLNVPFEGPVSYTHLTLPTNREV